MVKGFLGDLGKVLILFYSMHWTISACISGGLAGPLTHAVESPGIFELVPPPQGSDRLCFFSTKVRCQLDSDAFGRQQSAIEVKGHYNLTHLECLID